MRLNKKGVALLQVLIISAILAGLSTMILRATLSRTVTARQTRKAVSAQLLISSCMTEINAWWAAKTPESYAADLEECRICSSNSDSSFCEDGDLSKRMCSIPKGDGTTYSVRAQLGKVGGRCQMTYTIIDGVSAL